MSVWILAVATCARLASGMLECQDIAVHGPYATQAECVVVMQRETVPGLKMECRRFG